MTFVIRCAGLAGPVLGSSPSPAPIGQYLEAYDPEAHDGLGTAVWTDQPGAAMRFAELADVRAFVDRVPQARPTRDDGAPNRPLRAFHLAIESVP